MILTKRQKEFLDYIKGYIADHGFAPTLEEIGEHFALSSLATVHKHLANLESKGLIRRKWNFSRAIELIDPAARPGAVELPLLGVVAAGAPIETIETDDTFVVPEQLLGRGTSFVLRVRGDSMIDDGICDGDYIVVEQRDRAANGETVVALVNGEATVKRFHQDGASIRLLPANERMEPIVAPASAVEVRGVVVAVMRRYGSRAA